MKRTPAREAAYKRLAASGVKATKRRKLRAYAVASGISTPKSDGLNGDFRPQRAHVDTSPAVWWSIRSHVGDYEFVDGGLDEIELRALKDKVVYAHNVCHVKEPPFHDISIRALAAACHSSVAEADDRYTKRKRKSDIKKVMIDTMVFTRRQCQIIYLIAAGCTYDEMGETLGISARTAEMHASVLRERLDVKKKAQIPLAYKELTGKDPLAPGILPAVGEEAPEPVPLKSLVKVKAASGHTEGRSLTDVVGEMFEA